MSRTCLLAALLFSLWLPRPAHAQVEEISPSPDSTVPQPPAEPPAATPAPPAAAPAPTARPPRYSRYRTSWYIGFALGAGGGWVTYDDGDAKEGGGGIALSVIKVGWIARPWFLLGLELSTMFHFEGNLWWSSTWVQLAHYDVMATFFPLHDKGFYAKGGVGLGMATVESSTLFGSQSEQRTDRGFDLKLGVGYEWQLMTSFNLGMDLAYGLVVFDGGRGHDLGAQLSLTWY